MAATESPSAMMMNIATASEINSPTSWRLMRATPCR
jgi:hypothetical protein